MALNYPGPYELRILYTVGNIDHVQKLNIDVSGSPAKSLAFSQYDVNLKGGGSSDLETITDDWVALIAALFDTTSSEITSAELWKYATDSFDAEFFSTYALNVAGTGGGTFYSAGQDTFTFRTVNGGQMRMTLLETISGRGTPQTYTQMSAARQAIASYMSVTGAPFLARDNSYPQTFLKYFRGENEKTFRQRYR